MIRLCCCPGVLSFLFDCYSYPKNSLELQTLFALVLEMNLNVLFSVYFICGSVECYLSFNLKLQWLLSSIRISLQGVLRNLKYLPIKL